MSVFCFVDSGGVLKQCLKLLVSIILGVLLNVEWFGMFYPVYEGLPPSDLSLVADQFGWQFLYKKKNRLVIGSFLAHLFYKIVNELLLKDQIDIDESFFIGGHFSSETLVLVQVAIREYNFDELNKRSIWTVFVVHF